mmetsp:Transcript_29732/g.46001  ORF Transcript_29732/g.46001 Transcript_29732/m.46001 type:complete len:248 (+) Transcript_29732:104-847(+)
MYSAKVSFILGAMVLTGAARSVTAKIFYQLGFNHPLFLTLLYLIGQALSLIPYNIMVLLKKRGYRLVWDDHAILPGLSNRIEEEESVSIPSRHTVRTRQTIVDYATPDDEMERAESMASLDENKATNHDVESQRRKSTVSVRFASEECTNTSSAARASISFADGTKESDGAGAVMEDHLEAQGKSSTSLDPGSTSEKMAKKPSLLDRAKSARMSSKTLDTARRISASTHGLPHTQGHAAVTPTSLGI